MQFSRFRVAVVAVALSVPLLAACAPASGEPVSAATTGDASAAYGDADIRFAQEMIPHHRQTIQIAELVAERTTNEYVWKLSEDLIHDERADITLMTTWLRSWKKQVPAENAASTHSMPGMLSAQQISTLGRQSGAEFDRSWLTTLSRHLGHGVEMAQTVQSRGKHAPTADLAGRLITEQRAKIAEIAAHLT
ncbi:DUF305 domain-containing protein [Nonomuraea sp. LPB2021202275-12-8]|uniref:DUF305 domain-containing protein n=1 Tax=Nonomuraea sp. LPB2021202275-12-8 TaxID=3120159 RepID=UPI00300D4D6D